MASRILPPVVQPSVSPAVQQSESAVISNRLAAYRFDLPFLVQPITQLELATLLSLRGRLSQLETQIEDAEKSIQARLESKCPVEKGDHIARLKTNSRRNVAWKDVAIRLADRLKLDGEMYCARVLASTKPTKTIALVIE